jgi:hypothetical protein
MRRFTLAPATVMAALLAVGCKPEAPAKPAVALTPAPADAAKPAVATTAAPADAGKDTDAAGRLVLMGDGEVRGLRDIIGGGHRGDPYRERSDWPRGDVQPAHGPRGVVQMHRLGDATGDDATAFDRGLRARVGLLRNCYERALRRDAKLAGQIVVELVLTADGHLIAGQPLSNTLGDPEVGACMHAGLNRLRMPPPAAGPFKATMQLALQPAP